MDVAGVLAMIRNMRAEWAQAVVMHPDREQPLLAYGIACGRDQALAALEESITEAIREEEDDNAES